MAKVILLQPRQRILERARRYVDSPDLFAENRAAGCPGPH